MHLQKNETVKIRTAEPKAPITTSTQGGSGEGEEKKDVK